MSTHGGGGGHVNTRGVEGMSTHAHTHTHTHTHRAAYMFSLTFWNFTRLTEIAFIAHNHHGDTRQARLKFVRGPNLSFFGLGPWAIYYSWLANTFISQIWFLKTPFELFFSKLSENPKKCDIGSTEFSRKNHRTRIKPSNLITDLHEHTVS